MNRLAKKHGINDARIFVADVGMDAAVDALAPGQFGADEALINALGIDATALMFGLSRGGTIRFSEACADYNAAFDAELRKLTGAK